MLDVLDKLVVRDVVASLRPRERRLARLLMDGHRPEAAARQLAITPRAARRRLDTIRQRFRSGPARPGEPF